MPGPSAPPPSTTPHTTHTPQALRVRSLATTVTVLVAASAIIGALFLWLQSRQDQQAAAKRERTKTHVILRPNEEVQDWRLKEGTRVEELASTIERQRRDITELQTRIDEMTKRQKTPQGERTRDTGPGGRGEPSGSPSRGAAIPPLPPLPLGELLPRPRSGQPSPMTGQSGDKASDPRAARGARSPRESAGSSYAAPGDAGQDDSLPAGGPVTAQGQRDLNQLFSRGPTDKTPASGKTASSHPSSAPSQSSPPPSRPHLRVITPVSTGGKPGVKPAQAVGWLPSGSFVHATLLSGIDASTGTGSAMPYPVLMRLTDPSILPNHFQMDMADCFIIGAAWGDLPSERVYVRSENISCIKRQTSTIATVDGDLKGQVIGEDGKLGLRGRVVSKDGTMIARALWGSFLSGLGQTFRPRINMAPFTLGTVTGNQAFEMPPLQDTVEASALSGIGKTADMLAQFYLKQAQNLFPVIEISSGRGVDLVILKGMPLKFNSVRATHAADGSAQQEVVD